MIKIAIVTDGPYGERAYATIKEEFETEFVVLEPPAGTFVEEVEIPPEELKTIKSADLVITYILHPDLTLDLVDLIHREVDWIIVGAWRGEGFKNQLLSYGNVTAPENMCDLTQNGNPTFDQFVAPYYRELLTRLQERNIPLFMDTDGDVTLLVPWLEELAITGVLPLERQARVDGMKLRRKFPRLRMVGHFDKMTMTRGEARMRAEFERLVPLMKTGGFIASRDHQTPPGVFVNPVNHHTRKSCVIS